MLLKFEPMLNYMSSVCSLTDRQTLSCTQHTTMTNDGFIQIVQLCTIFQEVPYINFCSYLQTTVAKLQHLTLEPCILVALRSNDGANSTPKFRHILSNRQTTYIAGQILVF